MCDKNEHEQNAAMQDEEIEALQAIFADEFQGRTRLCCNSTCPSTDAPVAVVHESFGLTNAQRDQITGKLVCVRWKHHLRPFERAGVSVRVDCGRTRSLRYPSTEEQPESEVASDSIAPPPAPQEQIARFLSDPHTLRSRTRTAQAVRDRPREAKLAPLIFHGGSIVDRKSVFQGHACPVSCVGDVRSFLAMLLDDRKISRACHNMLAYRITGDFIIKDTDEDREDGAGSKVLHLMELTKAENVAVVVTRWCGGIHLGPDRFKHINACARGALEGGGFIDVSLLPQSRKKKHKKQGP